MPAKPLTPEQKEDSRRLKEAFRAWQHAQKEMGAPVSQMDAANRLGFGQSALSQYLNGLIPLNGPVLTKFSALLGVKPEAISPAIVEEESKRSEAWMPVGSALEAIAAQALATFGIQATEYTPAMRAELPQWFQVGEKRMLFPDFRLTLPDGSVAWCEVKSPSVHSPNAMLEAGYLSAKNPREFLLLMTTPSEMPMVIRRWLDQREAANSPAREEEPVRHRMRNKRPVWVVGMTQGGMPARIWTDGDHPVGATDEYADVSTSDPHAFACRVKGDSMVPRYMPGEFALVEPGTVPELEDDVLVRLATGETLLKRLVGRRNGIRLGSYNTSEVLSFREEEITWMYYVAHPIPARRIKNRIDLDVYPEEDRPRKPKALRADASQPADNHLGGDSALGGLEQPKAPKRRLTFGRDKK